MVIKYGWRIWVLLDSQAATSRSGARQRCNSGHDLQREWNIACNLRRSCNGRNIDAAPTDVVQQIVGHAETRLPSILGRELPAPAALPETPSACPAGNSRARGSSPGHKFH